MAQVFPTAAEARMGSRNYVVIYSEIRTIEQKILAEIEEGSLEAVVNTSGMTSGDQAAAYCAAWQGDVPNRSLDEQMQLVEKHFRDLGYQITRKLDSGASEFFWEILW
jgi:hypothetical protein